MNLTKSQSIWTIGFHLSGVALSALLADGEGELFFMVFVVVVNKSFECLQFEGLPEQYASGGVFGFRAEVNANAGSFRHIAYFGHEFVELGRPCHPQRVGAFRNETVFVFESLEGVCFSPAGESEHPLACLTVRGFASVQCYVHKSCGICNQFR